MKNFIIFLNFFLFSSFGFSQNYVGFVAADTQGAQGSYWHTSITLTNFSQNSFSIPCTLYLSSGQSISFSLEMPAGSSFSKLLIDILKENGNKIQNFFGWVEMDISSVPEEFAGEILMYTPDPNGGEGAIFAERTEVFVGEEDMVLYPLTPCGKDAKEPMALGGAVWRTNIGFINTSLKATTVGVDCFDGDGTMIVHTQINLNPKQIIQLNDVRRPEIWNLTCGMIKEPVICFVGTSDPEALVYAYGANNNNVNNFPLYISPQ